MISLNRIQAIDSDASVSWKADVSRVIKMSELNMNDKFSNYVQEKRIHTENAMNRDLAKRMELLFDAQRIDTHLLLESCRKEMCNI